MRLFVRAVGNRPRSILLQQRVQLLDEIRFEDMFNQIGLAIDATRGDVRKVNQIQFPQTMVSDGSGGKSISRLRESKLSFGVLSHPTFRNGGPEQAVKSNGGPATGCNQCIARHGVGSQVRDLPGRGSTWIVLRHDS